MGIAGRKHVEEHFDRQRTVAGYFSEIQKVLSL
jgi:hypothetical protein